MTDERLKQLMEQVGMPNSRSLYDALRQAYMEGYQQAENKRLRGHCEAITHEFTGDPQLYRGASCGMTG